MKTKYIIIPVVILLAIALSTWALVSAFNRTPKYDTLTVRLGAVTKTVSVTGSVVSDQKFELGFLTPGIVKTVGVKVGDSVKQGDLLVALDSSVLKEQYNQARASVASASAMLSKTRNNLRPTDINVLNRALGSAMTALNIARGNLQDAYRMRDTDINSASISLNSANSAYQNAVNAYNAKVSLIDQSTISAQLTLNNATNALNNAQNSYNQVVNAYNMGRATILELQQAQSVLASANSLYLSARSTYDTAIRQANLEKVSAEGSLDSARAQKDMAQSAYNSVTLGVDTKINSANNAVMSAESAYNLAYAQYQQSLAPAPSYDIASASAQVAAAAASARSIEAQIAKTVITAPIDGIITTLNAKTFELSPMAGPAVILEAKGAFQTEAYVSEMDIEKIIPGADVKLTFDALPGVEAKGTVVSIDPSATIVLGVVEYKVSVALLDSVADLKSAMTCDLEILTDQRDDVLFVPRQVLTKSTDGYTVQILTEDNKTETRTVQVGLIGDTETEIISGLVEGDRVVLKKL